MEKLEHIEILEVNESEILNEAEIEDYLNQIDRWKLVDSHHIFKKYYFSDYDKLLEFVGIVAKVGEEVSHSPFICFRNDRVQVKFFTQKLDGLTQLDFYLAKKVDELKTNF